MVALVFLGVVEPGAMAQDLSGRYVIRSLHGCSNGDVAPECEAELSWDFDAHHPMASVEHPARASDSVQWKFKRRKRSFRDSPVEAGYRRTNLKEALYTITNDWGCDEGLGWCGAGLSSDRSEGDSHDMASVEFGDRSVWKVQRVKTGPNKGRYIIKQKNGCIVGLGCPMLSWDWNDRDSHPMASVQFNDVVYWEIDPPLNLKADGPAQADIPRRIISTYGCDDGNDPTWCEAELSWVGGGHPMASVQFGDPVEWEITKVSGGPNRYSIKSKYGCDTGHQWCDAMLSWDAGPSHPMASVEFGDFVPWEITKGRRDNGYIIKSKYGCDDGNDPTWCDAELSWDGQKPHPMASVEFHDRVEWEIISPEEARQSNYSCYGNADCGQKIDAVTFAGTHNSASGYRGVLYYWGTFFGKTAAGSGLYRNQGLSFTKQLDRGIRFLDIDTAWNPGHPTDDTWWKPQGAWMSHANAWAGPVGDLIDQVDAWMAENKRDVVFICFNNNVHAEDADEKGKTGKAIVDMIESRWSGRTGVRNDDGEWPTLWESIRDDKRIFIFMHSALGKVYKSDFPDHLITRMHYVTEPDSYRGSSVFQNAYCGELDGDRCGVSSSCSQVVEVAEELCETDAPFVQLGVIATHGLDSWDRAGLCDDYIEEAASACERKRQDEEKVVNFILVDWFEGKGEGDDLLEVTKELNKDRN